MSTYEDRHRAHEETAWSDVTAQY